MTNADQRSAQSVAKGVAAFLVAVIAINVLVRVVPLPDIDLPSISFPDLPGWVHTVLQVKNWVLIGLVVVVVVVGVVADRRKR